MNQVTTINWWRPVVFVGGVLAALFSGYGVYVQYRGLEGGASYLVFLAPLVAAFAAIIPPMVEWLWKQGKCFQAVCWVLVALPLCGAVLFFAQANIMYSVNSQKLADANAKGNAVTRARADVYDAKAKVDGLEPAAMKAKANKSCDNSSACRATLESWELANTQLSSAKTALESKESVDAGANPWKAPDWLMPLAADFLVFLAVWTSLSGPWVARKRRFEVLRQMARKSQDTVSTESKAVQSFANLLAHAKKSAGAK